ncbi:MAG: hypothetical protein ABJO28_08380 [Maribacter dokdonensis]|uniref:Uncharacterized protein n=2 Tax=Maribacter dokdonensis TaxID=320912 RepID=A0A1H4R4H2_9FLAO|nr:MULTISPECIES: hypothetical protein [Maribacter]HAF78505.1 hypothetical protein [Maribacter sp.]APA65681.1 hypothetical protein YQ22_15980 [Maribacter sp. 1_2014MBL_MicDiv]KSA11826.1 hypothetical protein I600_3621 [Maribacter dokdonensis DSW-8]MBU2901741.1 hypothetical protein [Maribacter dokdonensis]MDP2527260.1 hypothetical protein [Maribacter dokdonensis]|tara:strand:- start:1281 stop:1799 length:519 start_codon:yes stop_codon:yes gene_type:complete
MNSDQIFQLFAYLIPSVVTGAIAFYFFRMHTNNEEGRRRFLLHKDSQKDTLPVRLQAYERMALFLERIAIPSLVVRVSPQSDDKNAYENLLIKSIETEFDHNLSQQIYMTDECWNVIKAAKSATIQMIRKAAMSNTETADKLREDILNETMDKTSPSATALSFVKKEIGDLW